MSTFVAKYPHFMKLYDHKPIGVVPEDETCPVCWRAFRSKQGVALHFTAKHTQFDCIECGESVVRNQRFNHWFKHAFPDCPAPPMPKPPAVKRKRTAGNPGPPSREEQTVADVQQAVDLAAASILTSAKRLDTRPAPTGK